MNTTTTSSTALRERGTAGERAADGRQREGQPNALPAPLPERGPAPERSLKQRLAALDKANGVRSRRAELKRDVKTGRTNLLELLDHEDCATMKLIDALLTVPKVGRVKANRALVALRISPSKTLGGLSARQRRELVTSLTGRTPTSMSAAGVVTARPDHAPVAPIHSVPKPALRGRRARGTADLLADIRSAS